MRLLNMLLFAVEKILNRASRIQEIFTSLAYWQRELRFVSPAMNCPERYEKMIIFRNPDHLSSIYLRIHHEYLSTCFIVFLSIASPIVRQIKLH